MPIKTYYSLIKPGVTYGNLLTVIAGFLLASHDHINLVLFLAVTLGMGLVIGSACAFNNYFDQDIDRIMSRTKKRAIVAGSVSGRNALIFASIIGVIGFALLAIFANLLTVIVALIGFVDYIVFYGILSKRLSIHGTLVGSISGAMPILAGYVAVTNSVDMGAILLFLILFFWQMPEFYSISIYRRKEYAAAKIPVMSVVKGVQSTKVQILIYMLAFTVVTLGLGLFGYTGYIYLLVMTLLCLRWVWIALQGFTTKDDNKWAKSVFKFSLIVLVVFSILISIDAWIP
ncbi:MAG: heme o synthase [Candidatus Saccharibacteria bacterium]|nr:heme o synthase [Candidatus Saccharibacteria bacterium]